MTDQRHLTRRELLLGVGGTSLAAGTLIGTTAAYFVDSESVSGTFEAGTWDANTDSGARVAHTDGQAVQTAVRGSTNPLNLANVVTLGPVDDRYGGSEYAVPYLNSKGELGLVDETGSTTVLNTSGTRQTSTSDGSTASTQDATTSETTTTVETTTSDTTTASSTDSVTTTASGTTTTSSSRRAWSPKFRRATWSSSGRSRRRVSRRATSSPTTRTANSGARRRTVSPTGS